MQRAEAGMGPCLHAQSQSPYHGGQLPQISNCKLLHAASPVMGSLPVGCTLCRDYCKVLVMAL